MMENTAAWQITVLAGIYSWFLLSSYTNVTRYVRSLLQPWVCHYVIIGTPVIVKIQSYQHGFLDAFFSVLSCAVSVPFYTGFLPLLFWSGHGKLARQMTLLIAFCNYIGNAVKDVVSAPRPSCPPVLRITTTKEEEVNAMEYGLPSTHTLNTVCLSGYLFHYVMTYSQIEDPYQQYVGFALACIFVVLIGFGRVYLGMHSVVDILGGLVIGLLILAFWLAVHEYVDNFVVSGQNVRSFMTALSVLLLFAYPTPELPTPSFEYHTAFTGVALGIVVGVQQRYHLFHHEAVPRLFSAQLTVPIFLGRMFVGIPTILLVKFCSKALAKKTLPTLSYTLGIPIKSRSYVPRLGGSTTTAKKSDTSQARYLQKLFAMEDAADVDTGIRFVQYIMLAWSVVDLVPSFFARLRL